MRITSMTLRRTSPRRALLAATALAVPVALGVVATGSANATVPPPQTWSVWVGNQANKMAIQGEQFLPGDITIDQGDSVKWVAHSGEPHTVTFVSGGIPQTNADLGQFNPGDPSQTTQSSNHVFDWTSTYESGVLTTLTTFPALTGVTLHKNYTLQFPVGTPVGTYTYYCRVHGTMMRGEIHVQAQGTAYPATQADYNAQAAFMANAIVADGRAELAKATKASTSHHVILGADDGFAMVMRFVRGKVTVHKGDTVSWTNNMSMGAPHTITFGIPTGSLAPYGNHTHFTGKPLSSGVLPPGGSFKVTFDKVGTFSYICLLHSELGMAGTVVVKP